MPIIIKDFTWRQTEDYVIVRVPLHNVLTHKVDLFTSDTYIKVHFPPFLFEACLYDFINEEQSKCTLVKGEAVFELLKTEKNEWPALTKDVSKREVIRIKEEAIERAHKKCEERKKNMTKLKNERRRECVKKQMDLSAESRKQVENVKKENKIAAVTDVMAWKEKETDDDKILLPLWKKMTSKLGPVKGQTKPNQSINLPAKSQKPTSEVPPPRAFGKISCDFTYRAFPTPCRESKMNEEEEWLKQQAAARRATGFVAEDLRPEENDPMWLLEKGLHFHSVGNYLGAVSAFSHAIKTWDKIPDLYVARSHSQLALGNWRRVLLDTTKAIELCRPHVASNAEMRFDSHLNRGKALLEIGKGKSALADFIEAYELKPYYAQLEYLMDRAENMEEAKEELPPTSYIEPADLAN
ncbi:dynein assembly factor 4, axonemal [Cimex lectularius]|uniref:CS domain-containing protein n=1 Tax=Cimex lectularius TaxID=79782 RepID=A0A8I6RMK5_CIMLE|nr:dynein assembly factor 4, axonemal [Cimex lectularius]